MARAQGVQGSRTSQSANEAARRRLDGKYAPPRKRDLDFAFAAVFAASFAASDSGRANDPEDLVDTDVYSDTDEDEE